MNNKKTSTFLLLLIVAMSAWATPALTATIPEAQPDKGLVVFYRLSKFSGKAINFSVDHADGPIGTLRSGTVLHKYFEPGPQTFYSQVISRASLTVNVEAGKTYFLRVDSKMGLVVARPKFILIPESKARSELAKLQ